MCQNHKHHLSRRDFLKLGGAALGGAALACGSGGELIELTAVSPVGTVKPPSTLAAGEVADVILVNGNVVTMNAQRAVAKGAGDQKRDHSIYRR